MSNYKRNKSGPRIKINLSTNNLLPIFTALYITSSRIHVYIITFLNLDIDSSHVAAILRALFGLIILVLVASRSLKWNFRLDLISYAVICFWFLWFFIYIINLGNLASSNPFVQLAPIYAFADVIFPLIIILGMSNSQVKLFLVAYFYICLFAAFGFWLLPRSDIRLGVTRINVGLVDAKMAANFAFQALILYISLFVYKNPKNIKMFLVFPLLLMLAIGTELLATARAALISGLVVLIFQIVVMASRNLLLSLKTILVVTIPVILSSIVFIFFPPRVVAGFPVPSLSIKQLFMLDSYLSSSGGVSRLEHYIGALDSIKDSWLFGAGPSPGELVSAVGDTPWAHNIWIEVIMMMGVFGFVLILIIMASVLFKIMRIIYIRRLTSLELSVFSLFLYHFIIAQVSGSVVNPILWISILIIFHPGNWINYRKTQLAL